ncbi:MAG TPA: hypothetical protein PKE69_15770, partial [Pyrinomonadaceae bacterium]|nr:hypothetical protein [Pyrinomonadaceae bacterium]
SEEERDISLVRINLTTNKEFKVKMEGFSYFQGAAYIPSVNKFLLAPGGYYDQGINPDGVFFMLDAETGVVQTAKGDFRALAQQTSRPLQPTGTPDESEFITQKLSPSNR